MSAHIRHLQTQFRIHGPAGDVGLLAARLNRVAHDQLAAVWGRVLDDTLGDDPAVVVLRLVHVKVALAAHDADDAALARHWARQLNAAVLRELAASEFDAGAVRFENQAAFVARFLADLVAGHAWQCWWYGAFRHLQPWPVSTVALDTLAEHRYCLPRILARLSADGTLRAVLTALDPAARTWLWQEGLVGRSAPASPRPLFAAALQLVDQMGWWGATAADRDEIFRIFAASDAGNWDWCDPTSLAAGVLACVRHLARHGYLRPGSLPLTEAEARRLEQAAEEMDWLDSGWLVEALGSLDPIPIHGAQDWPVRPATAPPSARHSELLANLTELLRLESVLPATKDLLAPDIALYLFAALVEHFPRWADEPDVPAMITELLRAWSAERGTVDPADTVSLLDPGRPLAPGSPGRAAVGPTKRDAMEALDRALLRGMSAVPLRETSVAGVFLLLRGMGDLHLASLVRDASTADSPDSDALLAGVVAALAHRFAGLAMADDQMDAGVVGILGRGEDQVDPPQKTMEATVRGLDTAALQRSLFAALCGQRLLDGTSLTIHRLWQAGDAITLVGGDEAVGVWPFGQSLVSGMHEADVEAVWRADCGAIVGTLPASTPASAAGTETLEAALASLALGRLGQPDFDLTVGLLAIAILRLWARWLGRFSDSSPAFLLERFIRRPGQIRVAENAITVYLAPGPLDMVLRMAGYFDPLSGVPWLGGRTVRFNVLEPRA